jgi:PadR family transcriptional regulator, regulatory protein PadR
VRLSRTHCLRLSPNKTQSEDRCQPQPSYFWAVKAVSLGKLHGYGVLLRIQQISGEQLVIQQGSLYPALYRLEHEGAIKSEWGESENNRRAKYYTLTAAGRKQLAEETEKWNRMGELMGAILRLTAGEVRS